MSLTEISAFLNLFGCVAGVFLQFLLPIAIYNLTEPNVSNLKLTIHWIVAGIGIFFGILGSYVSFLAI